MRGPRETPSAPRSAGGRTSVMPRAAASPASPWLGFGKGAFHATSTTSSVLLAPNVSRHPLTRCRLSAPQSNSVDAEAVEVAPVPGLAPAPEITTVALPDN